MENSDALSKPLSVRYVETFWEKPSALAGTLGRVGKLDPQHYAEPFLIDKAADRGIGTFVASIGDRRIESRAIRKLRFHLFRRTPKTLSKSRLGESVEHPSPSRLGVLNGITCVSVGEPD